MKPCRANPDGRVVPPGEAAMPAKLGPGTAGHGDACMAQFEGWAGFQGGKFWKEMKQFSSTGLAGKLQH